VQINKAIVVILACLTLAFGLGADKKAITIGIVDLDQAVLSTEEGKAARSELERRAREAEVELKPMIEEVQAIMTEYQQQEAVRSDEWKQDKQLEVQGLRSRIEFKQKEVQAQLEVHRERLVAPLRTKLAEVVDEIGREGGYSLILMRNAPGVIYSREALDITDLVIKKFNEKK
jgi:outer membrane protein